MAKAIEEKSNNYKNLNESNNEYKQDDIKNRESPTQNRVSNNRTNNANLKEKLNILQKHSKEYKKTDSLESPKDENKNKARQRHSDRSSFEDKSTFQNQVNSIENKQKKYKDLSSSDDEKNLEINFNENDDTLEIESKIKESVVMEKEQKKNDRKTDELIENKKHFIKNTLPNFSNTPPNHDKKSILKLLNNNESTNSPIRIENQKRRGNSIISANSMNLTTGENRIETKNDIIQSIYQSTRREKNFSNYSNIKSYLDESSCNYSMNNSVNETYKQKEEPPKKNIVQEINSVIEKSKQNKFEHKKNNNNYLQLQSSLRTEKKKNKEIDNSEISVDSKIQDNSVINNESIRVNKIDIFQNNNLKENQVIQFCNNAQNEMKYKFIIYWEIIKEKSRKSRKLIMILVSVLILILIISKII